MAIAKRYDDFSRADDKIRAAWRNKGNASDHGFNVLRQGDLLRAEYPGFKPRPDVNEFGFPTQKVDPNLSLRPDAPRYVQRIHPDMEETPSLHNSPKPRPGW